MAIFEERYGEQVRLVQVGDGVSMELCGGTHVHRTGDIGFFKILSEAAVGANVRRIEALTGEAALEYAQSREDELRNMALLLKTSPDQLEERVERLLKDQKQKEREIESLKSKLLSTQSGDLLAGIREVKGSRSWSGRWKPSRLKSFGILRIASRKDSGPASSFWGEEGRQGHASLHGHRRSCPSFQGRGDDQPAVGDGRRQGRGPSGHGPGRRE
jgi:alanyl-tRNA synthetase